MHNARYPYTLFIVQLAQIRQVFGQGRRPDNISEDITLSLGLTLREEMDLTNDRENNGDNLFISTAIKGMASIT